MRFEQYLKIPKVTVRAPWLKALTKTSMTGDHTSTWISMIFDEDNVSLSDLFDEMETYLPLLDIAKLEKQRKEQQKSILKATKQALDARGLPDEFDVYRGGDMRSEYNLIPVSLSPGIAYDFATVNKQQIKPVYAYKIKKSDVVADVTAIRGVGKSYDIEQELLVRKSGLTNQRKIDIKPGWWKSE